MNKEKTIRCILFPCRFNKPCKGCSNVPTPHLKSDSRCVSASSVKNWQSCTQNVKKLFNKITIKEHFPDEFLLICPEHLEFFPIALEMSEKLKNTEEFHEGLRLFNDLIRKFYECKEFFFEYIVNIVNFLKENPREIEDSQGNLIETIGLCLRILDFLIMKDMKIKVFLRKDEDLIEKLLSWLTENEHNIKIHLKIKKIIEKILFLLGNLNNLQEFSVSQSEEIFNFALRNMDSQDLDFYYHVISIFWGLCCSEKIKQSLKDLKGLYFFRFFNENNEKMDLQFQELMLGFLFFIYGEEVREWKEGKGLEEKENDENWNEIDKFLLFIEKNQHFYSYRVSCLF